MGENDKSASSGDEGMNLARGRGKGTLDDCGNHYYSVLKSSFLAILGVQ
jgi:hypothetical protein